jgi:hypothetical protein
MVAATDNAVPIVAIVVTGIVGVVAPFITSIASGRRLTRELIENEKRQTEALKAEQERLELQLGKEAERLEASLAADRQRVREEAIREVLDKGAVLMSQYRSTTAETKASSTPGHLDVTPRWHEVVEEVAAHRNRLRIWFEEDSEVVMAFDDFLAFANFHTEERMKPVSPDKDAILKGIEEDFWKHRDRYLAAARLELGGRPCGTDVAKYSPAAPA